MDEEKLSKEIQEILNIKLLGKSFIKLDYEKRDKDSLFGKWVPTTYYEYEGEIYHFEEKDD